MYWTHSMQLQERPASLPVRGPKPSTLRSSIVLPCSRPTTAAASTGHARECLDLHLSRSSVLKATLLAVVVTALPPFSAQAANVAAGAAAVAAAAAGVVESELVLANTDSLSRVVLSALSDCELAVSVYPTFEYNASGGGGSGIVTRQADGLLHVEFDAATLRIPPITYATSKVLGIPLPPPLKIEIKPQKLAGTVDPVSGEVDLDFLAGFQFSAGPLYSAPPLVVATTLTTEASEGPLRSGTGRRLVADGRARLVGVARVPQTTDDLLNGFLMLPTDALAVLSTNLHFS